MRGKPARVAPPEQPAGITPAHAGKTRSGGRAGVCPRDHPRACGENWEAQSRCSRRVGSPPRMRGKLNQPVPFSCQEGITPAHAGKTFLMRSPLPLSRDHPRACGENSSKLSACPCVMGSPPRMRGKQLPLGGKIADGGITPAHAGKTPRSCCRCSPAGDHPRACGENRIGSHLYVV